MPCKYETSRVGVDYLPERAAVIEGAALRSFRKTAIRILNWYSGRHEVRS